MPFVRIGRVSRAHGVRGELAIRVDDPQISVLLEVPTLRLQGETALRKITSSRAAHTEVLLWLEGVDSRTKAELLKGREVEVERASFPKAAPGEFYFSDLIGILMVDEAGQELGPLLGVWETGPSPVLVIGEGANEILIPYAEPFVLSVDLVARRMVVRVPELTD